MKNVLQCKHPDRLRNDFYGGADMSQMIWALLIQYGTSVLLNLHCL